MSSLTSDFSSNVTTEKIISWQNRREAFHAAAIDRINAFLEKDPGFSADELEETARRIHFENSSLSVKRSKLYRMADSFNRAISGEVACRTGCAHCCSMITYIYEHEAKAMALASGRTMTKVRFKPRYLVLESSKKYFGKPCPFLKQERCSIYESRPIICRLHHSFNEDSRQCDTALSRSEVLGIATINPDIIEQPYHDLNRDFQPEEPWGTIHDFFPNENETIK